MWCCTGSSIPFCSRLRIGQRVSSSGQRGLRESLTVAQGYGPSLRQPFEELDGRPLSLGTLDRLPPPVLERILQLAPGSKPLTNLSVASRGCRRLVLPRLFRSLSLIDWYSAETTLRRLGPYTLAGIQILSIRVSTDDVYWPAREDQARFSEVAKSWTVLATSLRSLRQISIDVKTDIVSESWKGIRTLVQQSCWEALTHSLEVYANTGLQGAKPVSSRITVGENSARGELDLTTLVACLRPLKHLENLQIVLHLGALNLQSFSSKQGLFELAGLRPGQATFHYIINDRENMPAALRLFSPLEGVVWFDLRDHIGSLCRPALANAASSLRKLHMLGGDTIGQAFEQPLRLPVLREAKLIPTDRFSLDRLCIHLCAPLLRRINVDLTFDSTGQALIGTKVEELLSHCPSLAYMSLGLNAVELDDVRPFRQALSRFEALCKARKVLLDVDITGRLYAGVSRDQPGGGETRDAESVSNSIVQFKLHPTRGEDPMMHQSCTPLYQDLPALRMLRIDASRDGCVTDITAILRGVSMPSLAELEIWYHADTYETDLLFDGKPGVAGCLSHLPPLLAKYSELRKLHLVADRRGAKWTGLKEMCGSFGVHVIC